MSIWDLGRVEYSKAWDLQRKLHRERLLEEIPDTLLLLEHPPTITIGKAGRLKDISVPRESLARTGVSFFFIDRGGGDAAYHGPGQIVGYPIMDLKPRGKDIQKFIDDIEEAIIRTMQDFSIPANRDETRSGVWVDGNELAAVGLAIRRWVSMQGFAINVDPDMTCFDLINPRGFKDRKAISMRQLLGKDISLEEVKGRLKANFLTVFCASGSPDARRASESA
jgi:lipoate-protein ligase B